MERPAGIEGGVDPDLIAEQVAACRSVARMSPGPFGEVATYLPGRRVPGVRIGDGRVEVHVVACWGVRVPDLAAEVRAVLGRVAGGRPVDVHVDDVDVPDGAGGVEIYLPETN
ncbi:MAG: hypothetical protein LC792_28305 [Actinobacteria bacterium]|nr:hypothetical protein [Actinomycetota bacterium]